MFAQQTTTATPEVAAIPESTTSTIAPINPIKPIIPIPQNSGDSGGITTIQPRAPKEDLTFRERMANLNLQMGVPVKEEEVSFFDKIKGLSPTLQFMDYTKTKAAQAQKAIQDYFEQKKQEELQRKINESIARESGSGSYQSQAAAHESKVGRSSGERMGRV